MAGFGSLLLLIECAVVIPLRRHRILLTRIPMTQISGQLHAILAVGTLLLGLFHSAGHFDANKSGTWLLVSIFVTTALGVTGRLVEHHPWLRQRLSNSIFGKLWRQAHRLAIWLVLGCFIWHMLAVIPLLFH